MTSHRLLSSSSQFNISHSGKPAHRRLGGRRLPLSMLLMLCALLLPLVTSACDVLQNLPGSVLNRPTLTSPVEPGTTQEESTSTPLLPETLVTFRTLIPENTPIEEGIYLYVLDEVTGLYLNSQKYLMTVDDNSPDGLTYTISLPFPVGSVVKYRYERQGDALRVAEHLSGGNPVRYRLYDVQASGVVEDVISRWTDTEYEGLTGRIMGQAIDSTTNQPIPNLLVTAGGAQAFTTSDGTYLLEGLPPGIHNLVGYAIDGAYQIFQQGAEVAADASTPAPIALAPAKMVNITFEVTPPGNTPPLVPLRLAGNLYQLGNTFGTLTGGVSTLSTRMPIMTALPDGRYSLTIQLPAGADIRYKYTLGDGFWNAEQTTGGDFRLRQFFVPDTDLVVQDTIDTWQTDPDDFVTFDITVPDNTPPGDFVSIQFNPIFGWTEPMPMWKLGENRWAYVLYSPLNLPGNLRYRYCRNNQCGVADDAATPGQFGEGRMVNLEQLPQQIKETVTAWVGLGQPVDPASLPQAVVNPRPGGFTAGIELQPAYHPSFQPLLPASLGQVKTDGANWVVLDPTWTYTRLNPPVIEPVAGADALWPDMIDAVKQAHDQGLQVALQPRPNIDPLILPECTEDPCPLHQSSWWLAATRDYPWWVSWFEQYRKFALHHADLAARSGADSSILGGDWLAPALPNGTVASGVPSGVMADAEERWRSLIAEVRSLYSGPLVWSLTYGNGQSAPEFLDNIDQIYIHLFTQPLDPNNPQPSQEELDAQAVRLLDEELVTFNTTYNKPIILGLSSPSDPDMQVQVGYTQALLNAINTRDWVTGFISRLYYPPAAIQDLSPSFHGKLAEALLAYWFPHLLGQTP